MTRNEAIENIRQLIRRHITDEEAALNRLRYEQKIAKSEVRDQLLQMREKSHRAYSQMLEHFNEIVEQINE